jgi:DNA-binding NarL/FixJ family response regulator
MNMTNLSLLLFWAPVALVPIGALFGAYLYFSLKVDLRLAMRRVVTRSEFDTRLAEVAAEMDTLRTRLAAAESRTAAQQDWTPQALNLTQRGQILRLHGKGRSAAEIASDLQISQGEVELLVKVHDWSAATAL